RILVYSRVPRAKSGGRESRDRPPRPSGHGGTPMIGTRPLGMTGARLPILGFGVSGPHATNLVPRAQTVRLIRQALEAGATLFDTAPFYGDGEAEARLGDALEGVRESAFIVSKTGTMRRGRAMKKNFAPGHIIASCEDSLRRLRC